MRRIGSSDFLCTKRLGVNFKSVMEGFQRGAGAGECIPPLSMDHQLLVCRVLLKYGRVYHQETEYRPSDTSEEVSIYQTDFHHPDKQHLFTSGGWRKIELNIN